MPATMAAASDAAIGRKHGGSTATDVWRYLWLVHPASRPFLLGSAMLPSVMVPVARAGMLFSMLLGTLGREGVALAGATLAYGMFYFAGVRRDAGSRRACLRDLTSYAERDDRFGVRTTRVLGQIVRKMR